MTKKKTSMAKFVLNAGMAVVLFLLIAYTAVQVLDIDTFIRSLEERFGEAAPGAFVVLFGGFLAYMGSQVSFLEDYSGGVAGAGILYMIVGGFLVSNRYGEMATVFILSLALLGLVYLIKRVK